MLVVLILAVLAFYVVVCIRTRVGRPKFRVPIKDSSKHANAAISNLINKRVCEVEIYAYTAARRALTNTICLQ
jgi:hypothetical protein